MGYERFSRKNFSRAFLAKDGAPRRAPAVEGMREGQDCAWDELSLVYDFPQGISRPRRSFGQPQSKSGL
jgi:hypothetical protein